MKDFRSEAEKLLRQLETDFHKFDDGAWDYNGPKPTEKTLNAIDALHKKEVAQVIGEYSQYPSHYTISDVLHEQRRRAGLTDGEVKE